MVNVATIARPYAQAVFAIGEDKNTWQGFLDAFSDMIENTHFLKWASHPKTPPSSVIDVLDEVVDQFFAASSSMRGFTRAILDKKRLVAVPEICRQFKALCLKQLKKIDVSVETPFLLDDQQIQTLEKQLAHSFGQGVVLHQTINQALIGGVKLKFGDTVLDFSVQNTLEKMKQDLLA